MSQAFQQQFKFGRLNEAKDCKTLALPLQNVVVGVAKNQNRDVVENAKNLVRSIT